MGILDNKVALVTGAGSGIGRAIAILYAKENAKVIVSDINETAGNETVKIIKEAGGEAFFIKADTSLAADNEQLVNKTIEQYGALHIACNNAGIGGDIAPVGEYTTAGWDKVIAVNLSGVFYGCHYQIQAMLNAGGGVIVNMASILGQVGFAGSSAYVAAKHGVVGLTKNLALEYGDKNIRAVAVGPAFIKTPLLKDMDEDAIKWLVSKHPVGRLGEADEVAELVLWLSSEKASFITGAYYPVDGGYLAI